MKRAGVALAAWLVLFPVLGAASGAAQQAKAEREQIRNERAAVEARFKQDEASCKARFVVSSCIADAQAQRRTSLTELRQRELALDEAKRQAEADEGARRLKAKQDAAAAKALPVPHAASAPSSPAAAASAPVRAERQRSLPKTADDPAEAAERAAAQQRRAAQADLHRQELERRNAERAARIKKEGAPLAVPSAAGVAEIASAASR